MSRRYLPVVFGALLGASLGLAMYRLQPASWATMNLMGVLAFASLGTSCGCLLTETADERL